MHKNDVGPGKHMTCRFDTYSLIPSGAFALIGFYAFLLYGLPVVAPEDWPFLLRNWGFHFWQFYPDWLTVCAFGFAILVAIPQINYLCFETLFASELIDWGRRNKWTVFVGLAVVSWAVFWSFRQKYGFLGDGYLRADDLARGQVPAEEVGTLYLQIAFNRVLQILGAR